jgi:LmbE family N-acetylglucosaminyl deacetylase
MGEMWSAEDGIDNVLVVTAHPDDVDFGAAGTVATLVSAGIKVSYCIVTDGDAGGSDRSITRAEMAAIRRREQTEAANTVGVTDIYFLGHPDGRVVPSLELRRDISRVIRLVKPGRVITQSPERNFERIYASHPDHLAAGEAALCAVYPDARNPFAHPELLEEGLEPHTVGEVWIMAFIGDATVTVDTTSAIDKKVAALMCHASQISDPERIEALLREWGGASAKAAGLPEGSIAESFLRINTQ